MLLQTVLCECLSPAGPSGIIRGREGLEERVQQGLVVFKDQLGELHHGTQRSAGARKGCWEGQ